MVRIKHINENFTDNNTTMNLTIPYNENNLSTIFHIDDSIIKKAKASCVIFGSSNISGTEYHFKSLINFLIINNETNIFLSNVSINQLLITDSDYNVIPDVSEDDYAEHVLYELIKEIFMSSNFTKNSNDDKNKFSINFNVKTTSNINDCDITFNNLSSAFKIGVFSDAF